MVENRFHKVLQNIVILRKISSLVTNVPVKKLVAVRGEVERKNVNSRQK
jgi:hypothetical protein